MCAQMTSAAPAKAPASMAATAIRRRPALDPCRLDRMLSGGDACDGQGEHGGGQVGHRERAGGGILDALDRASTTITGNGTRRDRVVAQARQDDRDGEEDGLHPCGGAE